MSVITKVKNRYGKWEHLLDIRVDGRRIRARFPTRADAETAMVSVRQSKQLRRFGIRSMVHAPSLLELLERRCATLRAKERRRARTILTRLGTLLPRGVAVDQITTADLQRYVDARMAEGIQPQSIDRELTTIGSALNAARSLYPQMEQWMSPKIPRPKNRKHRRDRYISQDERWKIIDYLAAGNDAQVLVGLIFQFALGSAMRHGEIDKLMWPDIGETDFKVRETKNIKNRYVPLTEPLRRVLAQRRETKSRYVFTRSGSAIKNFYQIIKDACHAVNIPYGKDDNGLTIHDCRHTATTDMLHAGIDLSTIQSITGHSDRTMILYYSHPTGESRAKAALALSAVLERKVA